MELLADEVDSEHVEPIERSLSRMETLIEDLLTLAREGNDVDDPKPVDVAALARDAWETTDDGDGTLSVVLDEFEIMADEARLRQLLENLFRNGVEHGGENVTITVGATPGGDGFYVADDGEGIPESEREKVFETGYTTTTDGTGFRLNIDAEIVDAHGRAVRAVESAEGGARFEITGVDPA
jgi:signal transduction histidine kinase